MSAVNPPDPLMLLAESLNQFRADVGDRFDKVDDELKEIKGHQIETNGRVTRLELWRAAKEAFSTAFKWVPTVVGIALSAGVTAAVTILLTAHGG